MKEQDSTKKTMQEGLASSEAEPGKETTAGVAVAKVGGPEVTVKNDPGAGPPLFPTSDKNMNEALLAGGYLGCICLSPVVIGVGKNAKVLEPGWGGVMREKNPWLWSLPTAANTSVHQKATLLEERVGIDPGDSMSWSALQVLRMHLKEAWSKDSPAFAKAFGKSREIPLFPTDPVLAGPSPRPRVILSGGNVSKTEALARKRKREKEAAKEGVEPPPRKNQEGASTGG